VLRLGRGVTGKHYAAQGNILVGKETVEAIARAYEETDGDLATRLLSVLDAGQEVGGDLRGKQSAALLVVREGGGYGGDNDRVVNLRVETTRNPYGSCSVSGTSIPCTSARRPRTMSSPWTGT